jgi:TolA-binding protein
MMSNRGPDGEPERISNGNGNGTFIKVTLGVVTLISVAAVTTAVQMYAKQAVQDRDIENLKRQFDEEKIERRIADQTSQDRLETHREWLQSHDRRIDILERMQNQHVTADEKRFSDLTRDKRYRPPYDR